MESSSLIFVTLHDGEYADHFLNDYTLVWCGQRSNKRDAMVGPGTAVWIREKKSNRFFTHVGHVVKKELMRPYEPAAEGDERYAIYHLHLQRIADPVTIHKGPDDTFTHNTVLRHAGYPTETGAMPHGIYQKPSASISS
jgi:hypothetical protein